LLSGQVVQSGTAQPAADFDSWVINYLPAFQAGLRYMNVGSKATFYTPSGLAFGTSTITTSFATIPPNTKLIYEVELVAINP
jgi:FKBP-type peptidyl-prolyl cis-trans isomerase